MNIEKRRYGFRFAEDLAKYAGFKMPERFKHKHLLDIEETAKNVVLFVKGSFILSLVSGVTFLTWNIMKLVGM